jgi:hypothetical protein
MTINFSNIAEALVIVLGLMTVAAAITAGGVLICKALKWSPIQININIQQPFPFNDDATVEKQDGGK